MPIERRCQTCGKMFYAKPGGGHRGPARYCSHPCYAVSLRMTLDARLALHTIKPNGEEGCWIWTSSRNRAGYGLITIEGRSRLLPRVVWEHANGEVPAGLEILHSCDTPACIKPAHLSVGTQKQNIEQCVERGRKPRGTAHPMAHLTTAQAIEIRAAYLALPTTTCGNVERRGMVKGIADKYGVSVFTVREIGQRKTWRHVA